MRARPLHLLLGLSLLVGGPASAQIDDLVSPLEIEEPAKKKKRKRAKPVRKKRPRAQKPAPVELISPLVERGGTLVVRVDGPAEKYTVWVAGREARVGEPVELEPGEHTVTIKRPGFAQVTRKIRIQPGKTETLSATPDPIDAFVSVTADVPGAVVLVDGEEVGAAPVTEVQISPGPHEVVVRRRGHEDWVTRVAAKAGREYPLSARLEPKRQTVTAAPRPELLPRGREVKEDPSTAALAEPLPGARARVEGAPAWYQRWYVWAGVGVLAAGAASAVVVSQTAPGGRPSPERVCGGPCDAILDGNASLAF